MLIVVKDVIKFVITIVVEIVQIVSNDYTTLNFKILPITYNWLNVF